MAQRRVVITSPVGLHARPAAAFASAAAAATSPVTIRKPEGDPVPAGSILSVLQLNAACGDEVVLESDGQDADTTLDALVELLSGGAA